MSVFYHLYCIDCKERGLEHALRVLRALITHADALASVHELEQELSLGIHLDGSMFMRPAWFAAHKGHHLVIRDDHGRVEGQCQKMAKCSRCGHQENCALKDGHEPPCKIQADIEAERIEAFFTPIDPPVVVGGG